MALQNVIRIKEAVSADLALRSRADALFSAIEKVDSNEVNIDFSGVKSISRSFAHQYQTRKRASKKNISETHVPAAVTRMFDVVDSAAKKRSQINSNSIPLVSM
jgi:hypothetical protein